MLLPMLHGHPRPRVPVLVSWLALSVGCDPEPLQVLSPPDAADAQSDAGTNDTGQISAPDPDCPCVPGAEISCAESLANEETPIICSDLILGRKRCQPDGSWGACAGIKSSEFGADTDLTQLSALAAELVGGCLVLRAGCLPGTITELSSGDCSMAFSCGHGPQIDLLALDAGL
jgi:hypothetical protein